MKQLVVETNNPTPTLWDTPVPDPGPGEILIKNHGLMLLEALSQYLKMLDQDYRFNLMMQRINVLENHMYLRQRINIWKKQNLLQ